MHASTQERELVLFNKQIKWTAQALANQYSELVGPPYSLEGREGMNKNQFQQLMHQVKVPMPRTGPFSSTMNNRLFNMFDKRTRARVNMEDLLHGFNVLSGDNKKDKLMLAFKAFDLNNKGIITLNEMVNAVKDITIMSQFNEDKEEAQYTLTAEQFMESAIDAAQLANLLTLGSVPATKGEAEDYEAEKQQDEATEHPPTKKISGSETVKSKPIHTTNNTDGGRGAGRGVTAGRGAPMTGVARGGGRGIIGQQHGQPHHAPTQGPVSAHVNAHENRERRKSANDKEAAIKEARERRKSDGKNTGTGTPAPGGVPISPRGFKPEDKKADKPAPTRESRPEEAEEPQETTEEMNARLVAHIRALQGELRKYMDFDKDNKHELEKLRSQVKELTTENSQLKRKLQKTSQESKQLVKEKEKDKDDKEKVALSKRVGEMESEIARQRDTEKEYAGVLQYLVGPPVERGLASNTQELRVVKTGYMLKRGDLIKNWKKRMFILRDNMQLIYYSPEERPTPRGILDLRTVVVTRVPKDAPPNVLEIVTTSRQWFLACDSEEEAQEWAKLLNHLVETNKLRPAVGADRYMPSNRS